MAAALDFKTAAFLLTVAARLIERGIANIEQIPL